MKALTSNQGYALLLTILTITIFTIIGLSLMGVVINNSKQIHKTETGIQSTELAEMGVVYNYTVIENAYHAVLNDVKTTVNAKIADDLSENLQQSNDDYRAYAIETFYTKLIDKLTSSKVLDASKLISVQDNTSFQIEAATDYNSNAYNKVTTVDNIVFLLDKTNHKVRILFNSSGISNNVATKVLKSSYDITLEDIAISYEDSSVSAPTIADLTFAVSPPNTAGFSTCQTTKSEFSGKGCKVTGNPSFNNKINIDSTTMYINGNGTFKEVEKVIKSTLYITGTASFNEKLNNMETAKIHVDKDVTAKLINNFEKGSLLEVGGNLTVSNPLENIKQSTIRVVGNADFQNMNNFEDGSALHVGGNFEAHVVNNFKSSSIKVNGDALFKNINDFENSTLLVGGDLTVEQPLNNFKNALIKVYGDASFKHINSGENSTICVFGTLKEIGNYSSSVKVYTKNKTSDSVFKEKCGSIPGGSSPQQLKDTELQWKPDLNVQY